MPWIQGQKYTFCTFDTSLIRKNKEWRVVFNGVHGWRNERKEVNFFKTLLDDLLNNIKEINEEGITQFLKDRIDKFTAKNWLYLFIKHPEYIGAAHRFQILEDWSNIFLNTSGGNSDNWRSKRNLYLLYFNDKILSEICNKNINESVNFINAGYHNKQEQHLFCNKINDTEICLNIFAHFYLKDNQKFSDYIILLYDLSEDKKYSHLLQELQQKNNFSYCKERKFKEAKDCYFDFVEEKKKQGICCRISLEKVLEEGGIEEIKKFLKEVIGEIKP